MDDWFSIALGTFLAIVGAAALIALAPTNTEMSLIGFGNQGYVVPSRTKSLINWLDDKWYLMVSFIAHSLKGLCNVATVRIDKRFLGTLVKCGTTP